MGEYWGAIKTVFIFPSGEVIGHAPKEYHKIWLGTVTWSRMDERKKLRTLLVAASEGKQEISELHYRNKIREVHRDKKNYHCAGQLCGPCTQGGRSNIPVIWGGPF